MPNTDLATTEIIEINPPNDLQKSTRTQRNYFLCRHIFTDGRRCGSPALRAQNFCYYHQTHRTPVLANVRKRHSKSGFDLTRLDGLDNRAAIQLSIAEVIGRVAADTIDPRRASIILCGLRIAGNNIRHTQQPDAALIPDDIVEDAVHGQLAPLEEGRTVPPSLLARMRNYLNEPGNTAEGLEKLLLDSKTPDIEI